jgi:hypothetical protein
MSKLKDYVETHRKLNKYCSAVLSIDNNYLVAGLNVCGLKKNKDYTLVEYDDSMPKEMKSVFSNVGKDIRHMYSLFEGPFNHDDIKQIKHLAMDDSEVEDAMNAAKADMEDYPEPITE